MKNKKQIYIVLFILLFGLVSFLLFGSGVTNKDPFSEFSGEIREFDVTVYNWGFDPKVIEVEEGTLIKLNLNTISGDHGVSILDFGISQYLKEGSNVKLEFIADKKGSFEFFCNVYCGNGHGNMIGTLIVK